MKTVEEIYAEMLSVFQERTGYQVVGTSDLAVRLYAVAAQVYALYIQGAWVERQCFPQSAQGEHLDQHAQLRGLERRKAAKAKGVIQFQVESALSTDLTVPAGTVCMTAGLVRFATAETATLPAGETAVEVSAEALEAGIGGNVAAETILAMAVAPVGVSRCSNPSAFVGGADQEGDEDLRVRVLETFRRMPNGANAAFYEQCAMTFEEVAAVSVLPRNRGMGTVDVVISTAEGLPDSTLLAALTDYYEARREIAVDVQVKAPTARMVDVVVAVTPAEGYDVQVARNAVRNAIKSWFNGARLGKNVLRAELNGLVFNMPEVANCALATPEEDIIMSTEELPQLNSVLVTLLESSV